MFRIKAKHVLRNEEFGIHVSRHEKLESEENKFIDHVLTMRRAFLDFRLSTMSEFQKGAKYPVFSHKIKILTPILFLQL